MSTIRALGIHEVLCIVIDAIADYEIYDATRIGQVRYRWRCHCLAQAARVNRLWHRFASTRLWENVDLLSVLKLLPPDAWYFYNHFQVKCRIGVTLQEFTLQRDKWPEYWSHQWRDIKDPTFALTRPISEGEWCAVMRYTRYIKTLRLNYKTACADKDGPELDNVSFDQETVYFAIAANLPRVCVFPQLETLIVHELCNEAAALRFVFASAPSLAFANVSSHASDAGAAPIAATRTPHLKLFFRGHSGGRCIITKRLIAECIRALTYEGVVQPSCKGPARITGGSATRADGAAQAEEDPRPQNSGRTSILTEIILVDEPVSAKQYRQLQEDLEPDEGYEDEDWDDEEESDGGGKGDGEGDGDSKVDEKRDPTAAIIAKSGRSKPEELPDARDDDFFSHSNDGEDEEENEGEGEGEDDDGEDIDEEEEVEDSSDDDDGEEEESDSDNIFAKALRPCHALRRLETTTLGPESLRTIASLPDLTLLALSSRQPGVFLDDHSPDASKFTDMPFPSLRILLLHGESGINALANILSLRNDLWLLEELHLNDKLRSIFSVHAVSTLFSRHIRTDTLRSLRLTLDSVPSNNRPFYSLTPLLDFSYLEELDVRGSDALNGSWHSTALTAEQTTVCLPKGPSQV
ncbi:hypothetical protein BD626DRAFT_576243 [Schizophyllum amplum]|uniref:Uncharacterized protein n=1 Tax=Schizophyllum amplum TaxID=97359 RepID=A0A550BTR5_9AGAR|nr:hypothetical protein BD626DRAFT_576243 [Auriculariopsis ampla]